MGRWERVLRGTETQPAKMKRSGEGRRWVHDEIFTQCHQTARLKTVRMGTFVVHILPREKSKNCQLHYRCLEGPSSAGSVCDPRKVACGRLVSATRISRSPGRARWGLVGETFASGANATEAQRPVHFAGAALRRCHSSTAPRSGRRGFHWMFAGFGKLLELPREPHGEHGEGEPGSPWHERAHAGPAAQGETQGGPWRAHGRSFSASLDLSVFPS